MIYKSNFRQAYLKYACLKFHVRECKHEIFNFIIHRPNLSCLRNTKPRIYAHGLNSQR
ncbi:hypothetical protein HMPREF9370_1849 [Neisseria wadsworthii 9715]|uniref:Uncharacterized protein n=1 Tax=Neisseria wadsworthii 9715 TaxID=1030841 RepID=G4CRY9_9NEIS|nr:hypothetical protein HMPREF9370_1849 [Neisseria wadsworthii 9715]